eukprot:CAMPEP_0114571778 /NCGR_PEP_ID=MMETSP0114-20121206/17920_1 /TAXON_ID=31324 /ORGANISM="Goniomonas sp, Strain m" /LENGTH=158 /DNA_ID=CAMNT_0001758905 /DNA_START=202 /DNA_END=678 /DNA_ORIENTATION=+
MASSPHMSGIIESSRANLNVAWGFGTGARQSTHTQLSVSSQLGSQPRAFKKSSPDHPWVTSAPHFDSSMDVTLLTNLSSSTNSTFQPRSGRHVSVHDCGENTGFSGRCPAEVALLELEPPRPPMSVAPLARRVSTALLAEAELTRSSTLFSSIAFMPP